MSIPYFEVLAFTDRLYAGNPAGVCLLESKWLPDEKMQAIAAENNLAETAFVIERRNYFDLRWFAPAIEIDLCGHATLASAHVIFNHLGRKDESVSFQSKSGELRVDKIDRRLVLDFPSQPANECEPPKKLAEALRAQPTAVLKGRDYFAVFNREETVAAIAPDFEVLAQLDVQGVCVTAPGNDCDFVSRYFAPRAGIPEDPVTGSTHCALIPYWSSRLGKRQLRARQLSKRGGELFCEDRDDRVGIGGQAVTYLEGKIHAA
jgi:PhzF family phenazine biosynthesis protein